jgi:hypothetical protein
LTISHAGNLQQKFHAKLVFFERRIMLTASRVKRVISIANVCRHPYSTTARDVWKESHSASFFAAAKQIPSIPKSFGVPEVRWDKPQEKISSLTQTRS